MQYKILTLADTREWNGLMDKLPSHAQDIYYTPEYYSLYQNYGDGKALCFVFEKDGETALYPFLINSVNRLGYILEKEYFDIQGAYGYNGLISSTNSPSFVHEFYKAFDLFCSTKNIVAEFARFHPIIENHRFSNENMTVRFDRNTVYLDLSPNIETIWEKSYSANNRNMIRKALKNNIRISVGSTKEDYLGFYRIYVETMKNVSSASYLYFNEDYFMGFMKNLLDKHHLILAKHDNEIIGGMILMVHKDYAHYHLSGRRKDFGKFALNNLFLDFAIKLAKKSGCKFFHFGGGNSTDAKDSLLRFKSNFSKGKAGFYIGKKVHDQKIYENVMDQWKSKHTNLHGQHTHKVLVYREV